MVVNLRIIRRRASSPKNTKALAETAGAAIRMGFCRHVGEKSRWCFNRPNKGNLLLKGKKGVQVKVLERQNRSFGAGASPRTNGDSPRVPA